VAAMTKNMPSRSAGSNGRWRQSRVFDCAQARTWGVAWGATTSTLPPASKRLAILDSAMAPAPTTRQGRFESLKNMGKSFSGFMVSRGMKRAGPRGYLLPKKMSYRTQTMRASIAAPANRVSMTPPPLPYLSSVIDELRAGNQWGNRNQAWGETSINKALTSNPTQRTAPINQPRIRSISAPRKSSAASFIVLRVEPAARRIWS
jgi:hypothetical protein